MDRRSLARHLEKTVGFETPRVDLEQYPTPPEIAASLVHRAALCGDLDRPVVDLGAGTGRLALGATLLGASSIGVEMDSGAIRTARCNEHRAIRHAVEAAGSGDHQPRRADGRGSGLDVTWIHGDARTPPVRMSGTTVVTNPPFGAQDASWGDRGFLRTASRATVSWSLHHADSTAFVEAFAADHGGRVTETYGVGLTLDRQFPFHEDPTREVDAIAVRIDWTD